MGIPAWTSDDFLSAFLKLLPEGRVWPKRPRATTTASLAPPITANGAPIEITGSELTVADGRVITSQGAVLPQALAPLMETYSRLAARDAYLLTDAFPATTEELLPEWELSLGLPDPCVGPSPTIQRRRAQVVARFIAQGGQSVDYYINFAATLGYVITIDQFAPSRIGQPVGQPLYSIEWAYVWRVNAPQFTIERFEFGKDTMGEPFAYWSNNVLQCELNRLKPSHTTLIFSYS